MKKALSLGLIALILLCDLCGCNASTSRPTETPPDCSFSVTWGTFGISSYDSQTGKLIKTTDATNPNDYVTTYHLSQKELDTVYQLIRDLDVAKYDDQFSPSDFNGSDPYLTLSLTVRTGKINKTVQAIEVADYRDANNAKAQKYLDTVKAIKDILIETDAWKALPDYEVFYD